jgi:hypothetical protein
MELWSPRGDPDENQDVEETKKVEPRNFELQQEDQTSLMGEIDEERNEEKATDSKC